MRGAPGDKGAFMSATVEAFFRRVAADCALRLDVLEHGGRPLAAAVGFRTTRGHHLYNMAFDRAAASLSPGIVLLAALIRQAIDDGLERFDFMRGLERYKLELGGIPHQLERVTVSAR
jgi:CelD/BcsL family acetyltransferase involved in cellulose biosynthesis